MIQRLIPSTNETIPVIGLGTWKTFDVKTTDASTLLSDVLHTFYTEGGRVIDSSPMYGNAEENVGNLTKDLSYKNDFFYATKVWIEGKDEGIKQMEASMQKMGRTTMDLMQIHNLVDWKTHLKTLQEWKDQGRIKYIGITHYTDAFHDNLEKIITTEKIDFVQFNYSLFARNAEKRLLSAAADYGVATLINRPFGEGKLFEKLRGKSLPNWAGNAGLNSWSQFLLKYIVAHPVVTCVIPATSNPQHAAENMKAGTGEVLDENTRKKMVAFADTL